MQPVRPDIAGGVIRATEILVFALAAVLAWRNFRAGKGDIRGASRLAAFAFAVKTLEWLCTAHHVSALDEWNLFLGGVMWSGFVAALVWTAYLALEPYVRRYWPQSMISWSHLLSGGVRDPLIGGHVLIGAATAVGITFLYLVAGHVSRPVPLSQKLHPIVPIGIR